MTSPYATYDALPGVRWSHLKHLVLDGSPLHYRHSVETDDKDTTSRMVGRALHTLVLQPERWEEDYAVFYGERRAGPEWKDFAIQHRGRTILREVEYDLVQAQAAAVRAHPQARALLDGCRFEVPLTWTDPETGIACKGLADALGIGLLADLKGCGPLPIFKRLVVRDGYAHQLAYYRRGARISRGIDCAAHLLGVEVKGAHDVGVFQLDPGLLDLCERQLVDGLRTLAGCIESGKWPGRYPEVEPISMPAWMIEDVEIPDEGVGDVD